MLISNLFTNCTHSPNWTNVDNKKCKGSEINVGRRKTLIIQIFEEREDVIERFWGANKLVLQISKMCILQDYNITFSLINVPLECQINWKNFVLLVIWLLCLLYLFWIRSNLILYMYIKEEKIYSNILKIYVFLKFTRCLCGENIQPKIWLGERIDK